MTTWKTLAPLSLAALLVAATFTPAQAQQPLPAETPGPARSGAHGFAGSTSGGGGLTFGGGMQFALAPRWVASADIGYLTGPRTFQGGDLDVKTHALSVDANVLYLLTRAESPSFTPYVLGGLGHLRVSASVSIDGFSASGSAGTTGLNVGGGGLWQVGRNVAIRPEVRYLMGSASHLRLTGGIVYGFGG